MPKTYVIDGYNLLHAMGILAGKATPQDLARARQSLLDHLADAFSDRAPSITVVFDASRAPPGTPTEQHHRGIHVRNALGKQEADDVIEELLEGHPHPNQLIIVSNDHRLKQAARRRRALPMTCAEFLDVLEQSRLSPPSEPSPSEKTEHSSPDEAKHWLKAFGDAQKDLDRLGPY